MQARQTPSMALVFATVLLLGDHTLAQKMYFPNAVGHTVQRANLDGTIVEDVYDLPEGEGDGRLNFRIAELEKRPLSIMM